MSNSYRLPSIVLEASSSKTWDAAVSEWHVVGCHDKGDASRGCLCGHEGIRYEFTIKNSCQRERTLANRFYLHPQVRKR